MLLGEMNVGKRLVKGVVKIFDYGTRVSSQAYRLVDKIKIENRFHVSNDFSFKDFAEEVCNGFSMLSCCKPFSINHLAIELRE